MGGGSTDRAEIVVDIHPDTPQIVADRGKLNQVLINLISNAVKYSLHREEITILAQSDPDRQRVVWSITDQGIGIAPEDQDRLFTPFQRLRRPETENISGSGLGLYIVKGLVKLMHGELWLESQVDKGSTFSISLPVCGETCRRG